MAKAVKRYGRGLNSFLYRPGCGIRKRQEPTKSSYATSDPDRYFIRSVGDGEFQVMDRVTGVPIASQLESREEAQAWINDVGTGKLAKAG